MNQTEEFGSDKYYFGLSDKNLKQETESLIIVSQEKSHQNALDKDND